MCMTAAILFALLCIASGQNIASKAPPVVTRVRAVAIISRESDRTPEYTFPTDPHSMDDRRELPDVEARLIAKGQERITMFADLIRQRYDFMFTNNPSEVVVRSSGAQQCIDTATRLPWSITRIPNLDLTVDDKMLRDPPPECPMLRLTTQLLFESKEAEAYQKAYGNVLNEVSKRTGEKVKTMEDAYEIEDTLRVEEEDDESLPDWATPELMSILSNISKAYSCASSASENAQRMQLGLFLTDLRDQLTNISAGRSSQRLLVYTTHDTKIAMLRRRLNAYDKETPAPYLGAIVFELHQDVNTLQSFVKSYYIFLNNQMKPIETPAMPDSCVGADLCPTAEYFANLEPFLVQDLDDLCHNQAILTADTLDNFDNCFEGAPKSKSTLGRLFSAINPFG